MLRTFQRRIARCGWRAVILRALVLAAGWWTLSEGDPSGLTFGAVVITAALISSISLTSLPPSNWRLVGLVRFAITFLVGSVRGGIDVACRALSPRVRVEPCVMHYTLRLPEGSARNLLLGIVSLMPGTLAITCEGRSLDVHVIAVRSSFAEDLATLEATVADATGERLEEPRA